MIELSSILIFLSFCATYGFIFQLYVFILQ